MFCCFTVPLPSLLSSQVFRGGVFFLQVTFVSPSNLIWSSTERNERYSHEKVGVCVASLFSSPSCFNIRMKAGESRSYNQWISSPKLLLMKLVLKSVQTLRLFFLRLFFPSLMRQTGDRGANLLSFSSKIFFSFPFLNKKEGIINKTRRREKKLYYNHVFIWFPWQKRRILKLLHHQKSKTYTKKREKHIEQRQGQQELVRRFFESSNQKIYTVVWGFYSVCLFLSFFEGKKRRTPNRFDPLLSFSSVSSSSSSLDLLHLCCNLPSFLFLTVFTWFSLNIITPSDPCCLLFSSFSCVSWFFVWIIYWFRSARATLDKKREESQEEEVREGDLLLSGSLRQEPDVSWGNNTQDKSHQL